MLFSVDRFDSSECNFQSQFTEKKNMDKKLDIPTCFQVLSEIMEATTAVLDKKVLQELRKIALL